MAGLACLAGLAGLDGLAGQASEITVRAVPTTDKLKDELLAYPDKITSMEKLWNFSSKKFGPKICRGTRAVLGEMKEKQNSGKLGPGKKWDLRILDPEEYLSK